jgi:hypothetical protein
MKAVENSTNFPFPEVTKDMTDEQKKDANRTRAASYRKAQGVVFDAFKKIMSEIKVSGTTEVSDDTMDALTLEAYTFLSTRGTRVGRPNGSAAPKQTFAQKIVAFFKSGQYEMDKDGNPTPGKVASIYVYVHADMDTARTLSSLKVALDNAEPADRLWVSYDSEAKVYTIEGTGPDAPAGWTGQLPTPKKEKDLSNV